MPSVFQVESTTDSREEAQKIAAALVEKRLAACVQVIGPIRSTFWWEGRVQETEEFLLLCKVPAARLDAATSLIEELHSYDVPEVLAFEVADGSRSYAQLGGGGDGARVRHPGETPTTAASPHPEAAA